MTKKISFTIDGKLHSLNEYIGACRCNAYKGASMKRKDQRYIKTRLNAFRSTGTLTTPCRVIYRWYEPNKRRDLDNISSYGRKVIQDTLVECGILYDDGWKQVIGFKDEFYIDKDNPRIEVDIIFEESE